MAKNPKTKKNPANLSAVQMIEDMLKVLREDKSNTPEIIQAINGLDQAKAVLNTPTVQPLVAQASEHFDRRRHSEKVLTWGKITNYKNSVAYIALYNPPAQTVFDHLIRLVDGNNEAETSITALAGQMSLTKPTIRKAIALLQESGFIVKKETIGNNTIFMINPMEYYIGKFPNNKGFEELVKKSAYPKSLEQYAKLRNDPRYAVASHTYYKNGSQIHYNSLDIVP